MKNHSKSYISEKQAEEFYRESQKLAAQLANGERKLIGKCKSCKRFSGESNIEGLGFCESACPWMNIPMRIVPLEYGCINWEKKDPA